MTEDVHAPTTAGPASPAEPPPVTGGDAPSGPRPELVIGGAFAGGFLAAMILKRLGD